MRRLAIITAALLMLMPTVSAKTITHDKYDHVSACYGIEMTLSQAKPFNKWKPWQRALFTTAVIGGGKEWYDHNHPGSHTASWDDIAADAVGAFGGATFYDSKNDIDGIGIGFAMSQTNSAQVPSIDKLSVTVDIRGAWSKAINGTDYSYGYTGNSTLKFNILSDGDFKFNYQITQNSIT